MPSWCFCCPDGSSDFGPQPDDPDDPVEPSLVDDSGLCTFHFIEASFLRNRAIKEPLPHYQQLRRDDPDAFEDKVYRMEDVVAQVHAEEDLVVSHRWLDPSHPDADGVQLAAIRAFLETRQEIKRVWFECVTRRPYLSRAPQDSRMLTHACSTGSHWCMPQVTEEDSRSAKMEEEFKKMLANVNMLYLGATVLIILDQSCELPTLDLRNVSPSWLPYLIMSLLLQMSPASGQCSRRGARFSSPGLTGCGLTNGKGVVTLGAF